MKVSIQWKCVCTCVCVCVCERERERERERGRGRGRQRDRETDRQRKKERKNQTHNSQYACIQIIVYEQATQHTREGKLLSPASGTPGPKTIKHTPDLTWTFLPDKYKEGNCLFILAKSQAHSDLHDGQGSPVCTHRFLRQRKQPGPVGQCQLKATVAVCWEHLSFFLFFSPHHPSRDALADIWVNIDLQKKYINPVLARSSYFLPKITLASPPQSRHAWTQTHGRVGPEQCTVFRENCHQVERKKGTKREISFLATAACDFSIRKYGCEVELYIYNINSMCYYLAACVTY